MTDRNARIRSRPAAVIATALCAGSLAGMAPAQAHVHASSPGATRGSMAMVTFDVPNESETGSATTELTITLPDVAAARVESKPGWTARLGRDTTTGAVRSITWTAAAGAGIGVDHFGLFRATIKLPDAETVRFPAAQRYADGTVVDWDQSPLPDGAEPEHPAPTLTLTAGPVKSPEHHAHGGHPTVTAGPQPPTDVEIDIADGTGTPTVDKSARLLAGGALVLAALGVAVSLVRRRR